MTDNERIAKWFGVPKKCTSYSIHDFQGELPAWVLKDLKFHSSWDWLMPVCIKLGMAQITTDINEAYKTVVYEIGRRNLDVHP